MTPTIEDVLKKYQIDLPLNLILLEKIKDAMTEWASLQTPSNDATELYRGDLQSGVDRILRDKGMSNKDVHDAINDLITELKSKYHVRLY